MICKDCGAEDNPANFVSGCAEHKHMEERGVCFMCAYWYHKATNPKNKKVVIDSVIYGIGPEPSPGERRSFLGMGGRRFDIEFLDGRVVTTHNLWAGGTVPPRWRSEFPDTAKFANGAKRCVVGKTVCWNGSSA